MTLRAPFPWFGGKRRVAPEGEGHDDLIDAGWTVHRWRTAGGYGGGRGGTGDSNRVRERIYFSPACIADEGLF